MGMKDWLEFFSNNGLALTIVAVMLWFAVKYGPKLINAHMAFVESARVALDTLPDIDNKRLKQLDVLSDEHELHFTETQKVNRALLKACDLIDIYAHSAENVDEIRRHTVEIRKALHG